jgi:hypothetical protein
VGDFRHAGFLRAAGLTLGDYHPDAAIVEDGAIKLAFDYAGDYSVKRLLEIWRAAKGTSIELW